MIKLEAGKDKLNHYTVVNRHSANLDSIYNLLDIPCSSMSIFKSYGKI